MKLFDTLRRTNNRQTDAMRQTTTLTMAYLLEQNRQFETYMREKVEELEARVAAQQARASVKVDDVDEDEATRPMTPVAVMDRTRPTTPLGAVNDDILSLFSADFELDEAEADAAVTPPLERVAEVEAEVRPGVKVEGTAPPEWVDWETALLGPAITDTAAPAESGGTAGEADELADPFRPAWLQGQGGEGEAEIKATVADIASAVEINHESPEQETGAEETEVMLPLADGPVEAWA